MPAPLTPLRDDTPLGGHRVTISVRIAWLLRMARLSAGGGHSQAAVGAALRATGVRTHARLMSEVENGKVRHGRIVDGYERALGLREGQLRAPVDVMCRNLAGAPADRDDASTSLGGEPLGVEEISRRGERVRSPRRTGGAWLSWARAVTTPQAHGFPSWVAETWLDELVDELGRSVGTAYATRYEALSLLRTSAYGGLVLAATRRAVADPHAQVLLDAVGAATDRPGRDVLEWAVELLADGRPMALRAGCHALVNAAGVPGGAASEDWDLVVEPLLEAYVGAVRRGDAARHLLLSQVVTALPARPAAALAPRLPRPPVPAVDPATLGPRTHANRRWRTVTELADRIAEPEDLPDRPILARLLLEAVHDPRPHQQFAAMLLLGAVPFADRVVQVLHDHAVREADERDRATILLRLTQMAPCPRLGYATLASGSAEDRSVRAVLLAHAGHRVEREQLDALMEGPAVHKRRALYAAGLGQDPWLDKIAHDDAYPASVRGAAGWWQARDGLVDDLPGPR